MADSFFCLDIGENLIKLADVKQISNQLESQALVYAVGNPTFYQNEIEKEAELQAKIIRKLILSQKLTKKNVSVIIPDSITYSQILEMPRLNEKELISAIKYQADQFIPMPIDETNIDLEILSEDQKNNTILVLMVAAPKKVIEKIQKTTELAGLIPDSIENELSATSRFITAFYSKLSQKPEEGTIIVNLGFNTTSLYFFSPKKGLILYNHTFNIGFSLFAKELRINLNITNEKAFEILKVYENQQNISVPVDSVMAPITNEFEKEIKRFVNLIADKYQTSIQSIHLINDVFRFPYLPIHLQKTFSLPTDCINPYSFFKKTPSLETEKQELSLYIPTIGGNLR